MGSTINNNDPGSPPSRRWSSSSAWSLFICGLLATSCIFSAGFNLTCSPASKPDGSGLTSIPVNVVGSDETSSDDKLEPEGSLPPTDKWLLEEDAEPEYPGTANGSAIPKIVHRIFLQSSGGFVNFTEASPQLRAAHASWPRLNPGYEMRYLDLEGCRRYLATHFHPVFLRAFDCVQPFAYKADLFRYAWIYREGGWYVDWKMVCLKDKLFDSLSKDNVHWVSAWDHGTGEGVRYRYVQTSFFGAAPRHPILAEVLKLTLTNIASRLYPPKEFSDLCPTGPCALGRAISARHVTEKTNGTKWGRHVPGSYSFDGSPVVETKCQGCDEWDQIKGGGNIYAELFRDHRAYCEDAPALFHSKAGDVGDVTDLL